MSEADRLQCPVCNAALSRWRIMTLADFDRLVCKSCSTSLQRTSERVDFGSFIPLIIFATLAGIHSGWYLLAAAAAALVLYRSYKSNRDKVAVEIATPWGVHS